MKILVINLMQIGDLVLTTPVFRALRNACPDAFIAAAVNKQFAELVLHNPCINHFFLIDKASHRSFLHNLKLARSFHFDIALNLNRSERAQAFAVLSNSRSLFGYASFPFSIAFSKVIPNRKRIMHQVFAHFQILFAAGFLKLKHNGLEIFAPNNSIQKGATENELLEQAK